MRFVAIGLVCAAGCAIESDPAIVGEGYDASQLMQADCEPQAWPIDETGHQFDRVTEFAPDGSLIRWWAPPEPAGIVFMLHANMQDASTMFSVEHEEFYNELSEYDLAYVAVSNSGGAWSLKVQPDNVDFARVVDVRDHLIRDDVITEDTPVFAVGFSGGSMFAPVLIELGQGEGWDVRAFSSHNTAPKATPVVASLFVAHENDNPEGIADQYEEQALIGMPTVLVDLLEKPLDPLRFTKVTGISETESLAYFDELVSFDMIDEDGVRLVADEMIGDALDSFERKSAGNEPQKARNQLAVVWRRHIFSADRACGEAEFLADQLPN